MDIKELQKSIARKQEASTIDKIGVASLLFMSDSLFFELMEELKDKINLNGNEVLYKIIRLFGGMSITIPSTQFCQIYEYFASKHDTIAQMSMNNAPEFLVTMRETLRLNSELSDIYLTNMLKKYKKIITREHITGMFTEQEESEAAWTKSIAKLKKIKSLK